MRNLSVEWFFGVPEDKKKLYEANIRSPQLLIAQVLRLCDRWEEELTSQESKQSDYDNASWAVKQAHRNGDRARIRKIRELFKPLQES